MPCYTPPPSVSESAWISDMLCKACKFLTKDQMYSIKGIDNYIGLYHWYSQHLLDDFSKNYNNPDPSEKELCLKEAKRLGLILKKVDSGFSISPQKNFLEKESE